MPKRAKPSQQRAMQYQYRLLWKYAGSHRVHELRADKTGPILKMLRRVATQTPWLGTGKSVLRKAWARLCFRLDVPFDVVAGLGPREVVQRIQDTFPKLDWVRVEHRQVGPWVQTLDPLNTLRSRTNDIADAKTEKMFDEVESWTPEQLDAWRARVSDEYRVQRRNAVSNNRENTAAQAQS